MLRTARFTRALGAAALLVLAAAGHALAQQAVFVVRHAEKADQSDDTALSDEGQRRALALAELLRSAGITHVITSEYRRTQQTAAPLASERGLTVEHVPARDLPALVAKLRAAGPDAVILVVAHSNTIPPMLTALGWGGEIAVKEGDYDDVFVVVPRDGRGPSVVRLKYGRRTS
jgi:phosphohistidine phosphatase SixA